MALSQQSISKYIPNEGDMTRLGMRIGAALNPNDVLLLEGAIGAGKSHLARAVIRSRIGKDEDIPSPTYTLVQTYETPSGEVWHADLYRLGDSSEIVELGLDGAFDHALVIIEWADRLPQEFVPARAIRITIQTEGDGRNITVTTDVSRADWLKQVLFDHG